MLVEGHGFRVDLPAPWEGALQLGDVSPDVEQRAAFQGRIVQTPPVLHLSSAQLPPGRGDFGSGAVDLLSADDAFVAIVEYGADSVGTALFDTGPLPRRLDHRRFTADGLQRAIPGQAGYQHFCTENGRALCLYVVLGAQHQARRLTRQVDDVLSRVRIANR
ncbi:hypothetical protein BH23ACT9_BH23ACT9_24110 [soil metagenome]